MDRKCFVLFFNNACSYLPSTFQCHFYTFSLPPFFPVTWLVVLFFLLLTAFFTNMVRCYIRTPQIDFPQFRNLFPPYFSHFFRCFRPYNQILTLDIGHMQAWAYLKRSAELIWFKKINVENKNIIIGIYERTCILYSFLIIQRTQDNLHVRLVQVVLKEASQDGTQRSLKISNNNNNNKFIQYYHFVQVLPIKITINS